MSVRNVSTALQEKAKSELNENPQEVQEQLKQFHNWILQQHHLRARTDDQWLLTFLRGCKFNQQRARQKFDKFYTLKSELPEFYCERDPLNPEIQEILKLGLCLPLSKTVDATGPRILLVRCHPADPTKIPFLRIMKVCLMIIDILLNEDDNFIIAGQIGFVDLKGMSMNHALYLDLNVCRKAAMCLQNAYPTRPKGFHCVNTPSFFKKIYNLVRVLLVEKIRNRIIVYDKDNFKSLHESIPLDLLPKEYGGESESLDDITDYWKTKVESYREWFLEDSKYGCDETKRNKDDSLNIGSFRKLDID